jgi:hypothetical protein
MAPLEQYLMPDRNDEIKLARSAAPDSISRDAEVLVLGRHGYETAIQGKNGFTCMVERSWDAGINNPNFWNPKLRGPNCFNASAARSYLPRIIKKTELVIAGRTKTQMFDTIAAAIDKKELPAPESGAMSYMLSKQGYLGDQAAGPWLPHLMFFTPQTDSNAWGADLPGSPIITSQNPEERLTVFLIPTEHQLSPRMRTRQVPVRSLETQHPGQRAGGCQSRANQAASCLHTASAYCVR